MKTTKIIPLRKIVKIAEKTENAFLGSWNKKDLDGGYMEQIFKDFGSAIPLGKKGHLWVRAGITIKNGKQAVLFFRKEILDKAISKMDKNAIIQRKKDIESGDCESQGYITEDYFDLIDKHLFSVFPEYEEEIKNGYVNLYDYILNEVFPKRGFYTEDEKQKVVFIEVKDGDVTDRAESMFDFRDGEMMIDCYYSFNDYEISSKRLEALKELGVTTLIGIESRRRSKEELEKYEVTQREMELYKIIKNEELSQ